MSDVIKLRNDGSTLNTYLRKLNTLYFPRLQINKLGEIILATGRCERGLTEGVLVGKTSDSKSNLSIGQKCTDWEVCGELQDYNGQITVTFENNVQK